MLMKNKLISDLKKNIPTSNVLDTLEERYAYAQDAANIRRIKNLPDAVVFAENIEQIQKERNPILPSQFLWKNRCNSFFPEK